MSKKNIIVRSAYPLFLKKGFDGVSMEEIAKTSNVAKQTLYSHFKGKDDLFRAIIQERSKVFLNALPHSNDSFATLDDFLNKVGATTIKILYARETLELYRLVVSETPRFPDIGKFYWQAGVEAHTPPPVDCLRMRGIPVKVADSGIERFLSVMLGTLLTKTLLNCKYSPSKREMDNCLKHAVYAFYGAGNGTSRKGSTPL